jgi:Family of unknown function (DUF5670)
MAAKAAGSEAEAVQSCAQRNSASRLESGRVVDRMGEVRTAHRLHESIVRGRRRKKFAAVAFTRAHWRIHMLYTIAIILLVAWLLGLLGIYTIGWFVHVLLVIAIVLFLVGLLSGRRVLG